jgi:hypothetical protein
MESDWERSESSNQYKRHKERNLRGVKSNGGIREGLTRGQSAASPIADTHFGSGFSLVDAEPFSFSNFANRFLT